MAVRKYPWNYWFSLDKFIIKRGVHYKTSQSTMSQTIRNNASIRGLRVMVEDMNDSIFVEVIGVIDKNEIHNTKPETTITPEHKDALESNDGSEAEAAQDNKEVHRED